MNWEFEEAPHASKMHIGMGLTFNSKGVNI